MPSKPAVPGLIKHQLLINNAEPESDVVTLWTSGPPLSHALLQPRVDYEQGAIFAWLLSHWRNATNRRVSANRITSYDFQTSPPTRFAPYEWLPPVLGALGSVNSFHYMPRALCAVIALRTQPIGSLTRDTNNGRLFHSGLNTRAVVNPGVAGDVILDDFSTFVNTYHNLRDRLNPLMNPLSGTWSVVSWQENNAPRVPPLVLAVNHVLLGPQVGYIRKRLLRAGPYPVGA